MSETEPFEIDGKIINEEEVLALVPSEERFGSRHQIIEESNSDSIFPNCFVVWDRTEIKVNNRPIIGYFYGNTTNTLKYVVIELGNEAVVVEEPVFGSGFQHGKLDIPGISYGLIRYPSKLVPDKFEVRFGVEVIVEPTVFIAR